MIWDYSPWTSCII